VPVSRQAQTPAGQLKVSLALPIDLSKIYPMSMPRSKKTKTELKINLLNDICKNKCSLFNGTVHLHEVFGLN
jgi:hypothetical protein